MFEKVAAVRIFLFAHGTIGFTGQLRDEMEVSYRREEVRYLPKFQVDIHLFKILTVS